MIDHRGKTKAQYLDEVLMAYKHDWDREGMIPLRRVWYRLKKTFERLPHYFDKDSKGKKTKYLEGFKKTTKAGGALKSIIDEDVYKRVNILGDKGLFDTSFIWDNTRKMNVGDRLPHIVIAGEKDAIEVYVEVLARRFGLSYYLSRGFSSTHAGRKLQSLISDETDAPIIVLGMTDLDKSGREIVEVASEHLDAEECYHVLLTEETVPEAKKDDYYKIVDGEKWYEIDELDRVELYDAFIKGLPDSVAWEIESAYEDEQSELIQSVEIEKAISDDHEVKRLRHELQVLETRLRKEREATFIKADPIEFSAITPRTIFDSEVTYTVGDWLAT